MASGFLEILNQLHDHHVEFVIVDGVAASLHGGSRVTFDLDIVPSLAPDSWQAVVDLLLNYDQYLRQKVSILPLINDPPKPPAENN